MSVLRDYLDSIPDGFVPGDLLAVLDLQREPWGARVFVAGVALGADRLIQLRHSGWPKRLGPCTVASVLLELRDLGAIRMIDPVDGGFHVEAS